MRRESLSGALLSVVILTATAAAQTATSPLSEAPIAARPAGVPGDLPLEPTARAAFTEAMGRRDYARAETLLLQAIDAELKLDAKSKRAAQLLSVAGGVFFLHGEWMNAAIALKKAEAIAPLQERDRFTLSMAYIRLGRPDWARPEIDALAAAFPQNALYPYWLGRIDYDARQYPAAIAHFERAITLDPQMMRAYDNLGLCFDYLGRYDDAVAQYRRAIELNRKQATPSPWPHLNLGITLLAQNKLADAEAALREALQYDARLPQAHYQLGLALEKRGRIPDAIRAHEQAAQLDVAYPEPHYSLGLLYQKQGEKAKAQSAFARFQELKQKRTGR